MQQMVLSLSTRVRGALSSCVPTGHHEISQRVIVPYAACVQLYPPEGEHLRLETRRGEYYFMNK